MNWTESKQVRQYSWLLKLLSRDTKTKTKNKDQPTNNHKNNRKIKNNREIGRLPCLAGFILLVGCSGPLLVVSALDMGLSFVARLSVLLGGGSLLAWGWLFPGCRGACGCLWDRGLGGRASSSGVYPAVGLQWRFACGFGFGRGLGLSFAACLSVLRSEWVLFRLGWPFPGCRRACRLCLDQELSARTSSWRVYPAGKLQRHFTCGFDFRHLRLLFVVRLSVLKGLIMPVLQLL